MKYDSSAIVKMAVKLDGRADLMVALSIIGSLFSGLILGVFLSKFAPKVDPVLCTLFSLVVCGFFGWIALGSRALSLRSEAQKLLCEVEQEQHLRFIATQLQNAPRGPNG